MKHLILAALLAAVPLAAQAETTTIERDVTTVCKRGFRKNVCTTTGETVIRLPERKRVLPPEPPRPMLPPSVERSASGVMVMRGMPLR